MSWHCEFPTFAAALSSLKAHFQVRKDRHCPLLNQTVEDTLGGTGSELQELIVEMEKAGSIGMAETREAVMDEAGDTFYGAMCYTVNDKERMEQHDRHLAPTQQSNTNGNRERSQDPNNG